MKDSRYAQYHFFTSSVTTSLLVLTYMKEVMRYDRMKKIKIKQFIYIKTHRTNDHGYMFDLHAKNDTNHSNHSQRQYTDYK